MLAYAKGEHAVADRLIEALANAWDRLTFLYELTHIVGQLTDLPDMLNSIVHLLAEVVTVEEVFLITGVEADWISVTSSGDPLSLPSSIAEEVFRARRPVGLAELKPALEKAENPLAQAGDRGRAERDKAVPACLATPVRRAAQHAGSLVQVKVSPTEVGYFVRPTAGVQPDPNEGLKL